MTSLCLTMIVKNEAPVLARCLASVRPLISSWCIVDTGSTDDTEAVARRALEGVPGAFHHRPWKDFAHNRTEAFQLAKSLADYHLVIDADDALRFAPEYRLPTLDHDAYRLRISYGDSRYERLQIFRSALAWRYEGVLHEHPACDSQFTETTLLDVELIVHPEGARSRDPEKYKRDAAVLEAALRDDPHNARYAFYLAQSYRDAGELSRAVLAYEHRVSLGGWEEEVYNSLLNIARLRGRLNDPVPTVREAYLRAFNARPTRAEALVDLAAHCRNAGELALAFVFAEAATKIPRPSDILFLEEPAYSWRALDELAVAAYHTQRRPLAAELNRRLLSEGLLPASERARIEKNLEFSLQG